MKYESTILKRLIDTYGVVGNPRYISEIIKEFILRGKECFPNLFTYQSDWLAHIDEFGLNPTYTVSYTGQSIYAPNTLERPVKSAILKGCTGYRDIDTGEILETFEEGRNLELVSVKMSVLTTTGKNTIYQVKYETLAEDSDPNTLSNVGYGILDNSDSWTLSFPSSQWIRAYGYDSNGNYTEKFTQFTQHQNKKFNIKPSNNLTKIIKFRFWTDEKPQLEKGTQATPYEPYKSNILTVNEPIELRGIGDMKDELNLLTGEAVERIGEIVLNEDITGYQDTNYSTNEYSAFRITSIANIPNGLRNVICDKVKYYPNFNLDWTKQEEFFTSNGNLLFVKILSTKASNFEELRTFLSSSPITIQYELAESIKTVDLTILDQNGQSVDHLKSFNGGTHVYTSSLEGSLVPSVDISVVTNLEETLKICSLEGNTM